MNHEADVLRELYEGEKRSSESFQESFYQAIKRVAELEAQKEAAYQDGRRNLGTNPNHHGDSMNTTLETITINGVEYVAKSAVLPVETGPEVLIRTYSAGVHIGTLKSREGPEVVLTNARRLWSWSGAITLNAVATSGVTRSGSRISKSVCEIILLDAIEVIPVALGVDLSTTEE